MRRGLFLAQVHGLHMVRHLGRQMPDLDQLEPPLLRRVELEKSVAFLLDERHGLLGRDDAHDRIARIPQAQEGGQGIARLLRPLEPIRAPRSGHAA